MTPVFESRSHYNGTGPLSDLRVYNIHFNNFRRIFSSAFDKLMNLVGLAKGSEKSEISVSHSGRCENNRVIGCCPL
jgi:hypothetical protein